MFPRIRPYFDKTYIKAATNFNDEIERDIYLKELVKKLNNYYPVAKKLEFFDQGRNSLWIALDLLNLKEGDEILVPCFTCPGVLDPIICKKLKPILIEISFDFNMNLTQIKNSISKITKAIIVTHFFGIPTNILQIKELAIKYGIAVIEDCAHTFCSQVDGLSLGSIGDLAFTSFQNDKPLSLGKGSMLIINNEMFVDRFEIVIDNLQRNSLDDEKFAFLSLLFFNMNTNSLKYSKFIGVDDYYSYFKKNISSPDDLLTDLNENELSEFIDISKKEDLLQELKSIFKNLFVRYKLEDPSTPLLMNCFSLNLLTNSMNKINLINKTLTKNGSIYANNLDKNNLFISSRLKNIPYLRYSIVCLNSKFRNKLKNNLITNQCEVDNFNWGITLNRILKHKGDYKNCEFLANNILNLPSHTYMKEEDIINICNFINKESKNYIRN